MLLWCKFLLPIYHNTRYIGAHALEDTVKEGYSTVYVINIVFQSIFTLLWQIGVAILAGWLCIDLFGAPDWVYVPLIIAGVITGFVSMIRFILAAMNALDRIERERKQKHKKIEEKRNGNKK